MEGRDLATVGAFMRIYVKDIWLGLNQGAKGWDADDLSCSQHFFCFIYRRWGATKKKFAAGNVRWACFSCDYFCFKI